MRIGVKMNKDKEVCYMYKCRQCGKTFADIYSGVECLDDHVLINAIYKIAIKNQPPVPMMTTHKCNKSASGIADLVGYKIK